MRTAQIGDTVTVYYVSALSNGEIINDMHANEPFTFTLGQEQVIPGFEQGVLGMKEGEKKTFIVPAEQAFGPYLEELVVTVDRSELPQDLELVEGENYVVTTPDQQTFEVWVKEIGETTVTLDANHPLAGKDLEFTVELLKIQ